MKLRELVLALSLPFLTSCVTETTLQTKIIKAEFYPLDIRGYINREILEYNNQKIEIVALKENNKKYYLVFAQKNPELINFLSKRYGVPNKILFITNEKTEELIIN